MYYKLLLPVLLGWALSAVASTDPLLECQGCHGPQRQVAASRFANGFGHWRDSQCFGCHAEITDVARNIRQGKQDRRYVALPVEEARLADLAQHGMPYLHAPAQPIRPGRFDASALLQFLQRPHGRCHGAGCQAPAMMAYPALTAADLKSWQQNVSKSSPAGQARRGGILFSQQCAKCHDGRQAPYDVSELSLFSASWLQNYWHKPAATAGFRAELSMQDSADLLAFFRGARQQRQQQLDQQMTAVDSSWRQLTATPVSEANIRYLWQHFWRDANCVHCHGIEGRARQRFDVSDAGLRTYLQQGHAKQLFYRLKIRQLEQQYGIGAAVPGMPMSGAALPDPVIHLLGRWMKQGCPDPQHQQQCPYLRE